MEKITSRGLEISALSCHGNPLHPRQEVARSEDERFRKTARLASQLGVQNVIAFSGCPGEGPNATKPNWVTCPWPTEYSEILNWQWDEVATPYWTEACKFAADKKSRWPSSSTLASSGTTLRASGGCGRLGATLSA